VKQITFKSPVLPIYRDKWVLSEVSVKVKSPAFLTNLEGLNILRNDFCGQVTEKYLDQQDEVCGWFGNSRDHGGFIFSGWRDQPGRGAV